MPRGTLPSMCVVAWWRNRHPLARPAAAWVNRALKKSTRCVAWAPYVARTSRGPLGLTHCFTRFYIVGPLLVGVPRGCAPVAAWWWDVCMPRLRPSGMTQTVLAALTYLSSTLQLGPVVPCCCASRPKLNAAHATADAAAAAAALRGVCGLHIGSALRQNDVCSALVPHDCVDTRGQGPNTCNARRAVSNAAAGCGLPTRAGMKQPGGQWAGNNVACM